MSARRAIWKSKYEWKPVLVAGLILILMGLIWHYRHLRVLLYPMDLATVIKVIAYGIIPLLLGLAGTHFVAESVHDVTYRRTLQALFVGVSVVGVILITGLEKKVDEDHQKEVTELKASITSVQVQNSKILEPVISTPPIRNFLARQAVQFLAIDEVIGHAEPDRCGRCRVLPKGGIEMSARTQHEPATGSKKS